MGTRYFVVVEASTTFEVLAQDAKDAEKKVRTRVKKEHKIDEPGWTVCVEAFPSGVLTPLEEGRELSHRSEFQFRVVGSDGHMMPGLFREIRRDRSQVEVENIKSGVRTVVHFSRISG
jgi:hypothetical protein